MITKWQGLLVDTRVSAKLSWVKNIRKERKFWKYSKVTANPKVMENFEKVMEKVLESHGIGRAWKEYTLLKCVV